MRLHRFYVNFPLGEEVVVENVNGGKELIHQWTHVFRYTSGDEVFLFSQYTSGYDFLYRIASLSKEAITLTLVSSSSNSVPSSNITLCMALVKKDTFETIVRQATELGVSHIIPVSAARSEKKNLNFERLSSIAIEASEQSGRGTVPVLDTILSFDEALAQTKNSINIVGSLHGNTLQTVFDTSYKSTQGYTLWVGPEGGWTNEEEQAMVTHSFILFTLMQTTLKADTAVVALLSALSTAPSRT